MLMEGTVRKEVHEASCGQEGPQAGRGLKSFYSFFFISLFVFILAILMDGKLFSFADFFLN